MKKVTRIWGYCGAVALVALMVLLALIADYTKTHGYGAGDAIISFIDGVTLPVMALWNVVFKMLGYQQDPGYMFVIPFIASSALYFAIIGFFIGALARKFYEL